MDQQIFGKVFDASQNVIVPQQTGIDDKMPKLQILGNLIFPSLICLFCFNYGGTKHAE